MGFSLCCLSSLNLARWEEWNEYKFENGMTLPELTCWFLEGALQEFIDRAKNIKVSGLGFRLKTSSELQVTLGIFLMDKV